MSSVSYLSGSFFPFPLSFGPGVSGGWLIGDTIGNLWTYNSGSFNEIDIPESSYGYSTINYYFVSAGNIFASDAGFGILNLTTGSTSVTGYSVSGGPFFSCVSSTYGLFAFNISGSFPLGASSGALVYLSSGALTSGLGGIQTYYASGLTTGAGLPVYYVGALTSGGGSILLDTGLPFWGGNPQTQGNNFYAYMGPSGFSEISLLSPTSGTSGITGNVSGIAESTCLSYLPLSSSLLIGGQAPAVFSSGSTALCINASSPAVMLTTAPSISGGTIYAWGQPSGSVPSGYWSYVNSSSGLGLGTSLALQFANLTGAVIIDSTSGLFRSISYIGGSITQIQTAAVSSVVPYLGIFSGNTALFPQTSTSSVIQAKLSGASWTLSGAILTGVPNPAAILVSGFNAAVGFASGLSIIQYLSSWNLVSSVSLPFQPTSISIDISGNYYTAGQGYNALVSPSGFILASGQFDSGAPTVLGSSIYNSQYYTITSAYVETFSYEPWNQSLTSMSSFSPLVSSWLTFNGVSWAQSSGSLTFSGALWITDAIYIPSKSGIIQLVMESPFNLTYRQAGSMVLHNSGGFYGFSGFGIGNVPCTIGIDGAGDPRIITNTGNMLTLNSAGVLSSISQLYSGGGGLVSFVSGSSGMFGAASMAPAIVGSS